MLLAKDESRAQPSRVSARSMNGEVLGGKVRERRCGREGVGEFSRESGVHCKL